MIEHTTSPNSCIEPENRYLDPSTSSSSFLRDAKVLLEQGGSLTEAALMIEAAIQKNDLGEGGYEAWLLLGEVRSMDEREEQSMRALTEGVKRAEASGAAGAGMMVRYSVYLHPFRHLTIFAVFGHLIHE